MSLRRLAPIALLAVALSGASVAGLALGGSTASAQSEPNSFIIPANDGYGVADCLAEGASCGRIVADAWCQAHGLGKATAFGPVDATDITASVKTPTTPPRSYTVTCAQ